MLAVVFTIITFFRAIVDKSWSLAGWGALATVVLYLMMVWIVLRDERYDQYDPMRRRAKEISTALTRSAGSLSEATVLLTELKEELTGRMKALELLRQQIDENEHLAEISSESAKAMDQVIVARIREQERRIRIVAWRQGIVFAVFGAAVAVAAVIFGHWLPTLK